MLPSASASGNRAVSAPAAEVAVADGHGERGVAVIQRERDGWGAVLFLSSETHEQVLREQENELSPFAALSFLSTRRRPLEQVNMPIQVTDKGLPFAIRAIKIEFSAHVFAEAILNIAFYLLRAPQ